MLITNLDPKNNNFINRKHTFFCVLLVCGILAM